MTDPVTPPTATTPRRIELARNIQEQWWGHLIIAASLSVVFGEIDGPWFHYLYVFGANLLLSVCIGSVITAVYVFAWGTVLIPGGIMRRALGHGSAIVVGVVVGTELALLVLRVASVAGLDLSINRFGVWRVGLVVSVVAMLGSVTYDRLRERVRQTELREQQAQQALLRAQFESLQAKVNPHFLFNALNTVASLIEDDPPVAVEAVERLSTLLRRSLERSQRGQIALRDELDAVHSYLALERLRFGDRLQAQVEVDPSLESIPVPPFVLQPLVENAVKHGIAARRDGGTVRVQARRQAQTLTLRVHDDGPGDAAAGGTKSGHETLRQRLRLMYDDRASFEAGSREDGNGYQVDIAIPIEEAISA